MLPHEVYINLLLPSLLFIYWLINLFIYLSIYPPSRGRVCLPGCNAGVHIS